MSQAKARHLSSYSDRLAAAQIASALLMSRRPFEPVIRQALEEVVFQREPRLDVLAWVTKIQREEVGA
jgi:hypothetical protein